MNSQTIQGKILDQSDEPVTVANVLLKNGYITDDISEYTFTRDGKYQISLKKNYQRIFILIDAYGFEKDSFAIESPDKTKVYTINFKLKQASNELEEVVIYAKKKPFTIKKDTIEYNVGAYLDGSEKKVQDLIKKLPGVNLNESTGEIKYKGKSIETVLLEGDNLFDNNYTLGTKNINIDVVEQIQAIENYSENPLLKNIENSDKVALNLKLKKGKIDLSGNIDIGGGLFSEEINALNINANIIQITKTYKSFVTFAHNNIGINNSPFDYFGSGKNMEQIKEKDYLAEKIIPETQFSNIIDEKRANINNQYFGNYNSIFKISKKLKIKTNLYFISDKITSEQYIENRYIINNSNFSTTDNYFINKSPFFYRGDIEVKYNISKNALIENDLRLRKENINTSSFILSNNNTFNSFLKSEDFNFKNSFSYTKRLSNKKAFQLLINESYNNISQHYKIEPENYNLDSSSIQKINYTKDFFEAKAIILGSKSNHKYTYSLGTILDEDKLDSELLSKNFVDFLSTDNVTNKSKFSSNSICNSVVYDFNFGKWQITPKYLFSLLIQRLKNINSNDEEKVKNRLLFEPSFNIKYKLNNVSFLLGKLDLNKNSIAQKYLFQNQILINNRATISNVPSLELQKTFSAGIFYFNNDIYNQLQINTGLNYRNIQGNFFANSLINENLTRINYFYLPEDYNDFIFNFSTSKYIRYIDSNVKLNFDYSLSEYKNIVNESILRNNQDQSLKAEFNFKTVFNGFINFENNFGYSKLISQNIGDKIFTNEAIYNSFKILLKPTKKFFFIFSSDYFLPNIENKSENYLFIDASLRYRPKNKIEFNLVSKNILNENNFEQIEVTDFSTNIYRTNILPRYIFLNMSFNF